MRRIGWHLDDVPQPYLTLRRLAFAVIVLLSGGACVCGVLLPYDGTHHKSLIGPLVMLGAVMVLGAIVGGLFGWTNKKSPRWQEWQKTMHTMTPGWPSDT
jgi:hypothetical protein